MKGFFKILATVWRWISPAANTAQAALIRAIATDLVRSWLLKHPAAKELIDTQIIPLIQLLMSMTGAKYDTAERVIQSVFQELQTESAGNTAFNSLAETLGQKSEKTL